MQNQITVAQLNNYVKAVFDAEEMLHNIWVVGEVSQIKQSGNATFFTLKDEAASVASVTYVAGVLAGIKDGDKVSARGSITYWQKAGKVAFTVTKCEASGVGALAEMFRALQEKLKKEGLFDVATKKQLPREIRRIGLVTSRTGAVIHDIKTVAWRRNPSVDLVLIDTRVQGEGAENEIATGIELFNSSLRTRNECGNLHINPPDVIIVARGGGSAEDLRPFNTEIVARAVFASKIPVISAVGHESDFTLIDFVADLRAPTPSAAAELCVKEVVSERERVLAAWYQMRMIAKHKVSAVDALEPWAKFKERAGRRLDALAGSINVAAASIEAKNPIAVLQKGYARTNVAPETLKTGDEFEIMFYNRKTKATNRGVAEWKRKI